MSQSQISLPEFTIAIANANAVVANTAQKNLFVGQQTAAASAADGALTTNIGNEGEEDALFGPSSQLAGAIRAFRRVNGSGRVDAIGLDDDGSGVPRVVDFTVAGSPTAAGTITVIGGSERDHKFVVAIATTDSVTDIADAITAAFLADTKCPYTAGNVAGAVTLTADNDGTIANDEGIEVIVGTAGVTVAAVTNTTPGSVDPTLTRVLLPATERYQGVNWPWRDETAVSAYLLPRFNPTNAVLDGTAFLPLVDTLANITDGSTGVLDVLNDQTLVYFVDQLESETLYKGPSSNEKGYVKAAYFMGIRALRLTPNENIANFVTSRQSREQIGGVALASLPYFNTPLALVPLIKQGRGWEATEITTIRDAGGTVIGNNTGGTGILVGEVVSTYKTDGASNPDPTFKFLNYIDTEVNIREYRFNNAKARYAQSRLTQGTLARNRDVANQASIKAFFEKLYKDTSGGDFMLTQDGDTAEAFYKANLDVSINLATGLVTVNDKTPVVTQLRGMTMTMKVTFSVT